jgi:3-deoxy-D-manno-octulosonic-acid transferase
MHCASLGEFEQGRPVLEALHKEVPDARLILTFFSPSGFEMRKNYPLATGGVFYLPLDGPASARDFLDIVRPEAAIFVKYEFWYFYLRELKNRGVPTVLVSAIFRKEQAFFKLWGGWFRKMLGYFSALFVQDEASRELLDQIGVKNVEVAGDTRIDRVLDVAQEAMEWPVLDRFCAGARVLVAGSVWPPDERLLQAWLSDAVSEGWKCILAPHEIEEEHILGLTRTLPGPVVRYTAAAKGGPVEGRVMLLDTVGMLASAYRYGELAYVGGGFGKGIHNVLEPMAHGLPVFFGPRHEKFREARLLIESGAAFPVRSEAGFVKKFGEICSKSDISLASQAGMEILERNKGATLRISAYIAGHFSSKS